MHKIPNYGTYSGDFKDGLRHGLGILTLTPTLTHANLEVYEGGWSEGRRNGCGLYTDTKGDQYTGFWEMNRIIKYFKVDNGDNSDSSGSFVFGSPKGNHTIEPEL